MIEISKYVDLKPETKSQLNTIIHNEFGHIPIVRETEWASPDWTIIHYEQGTIATFYNIIERNISIDNKPVKIAGINNVITPKPYRGKGYASKTLKDTESFIFDDLKCEAGLLLCAKELIPFYEKLSWYTVNCPVHVNQSDGERRWTAVTMLLTNGYKLNPKEIHLNGLPW